MDDLLRLLPHGYPMRLVDRVVSVRPGIELEAVSVISAREPCYAAGIGPYPAVLLLEALIQTAALLWLADLEADGPAEVLLAAVRGARFGAAAQPGDVVRHQAVLRSATARRAILAGRTDLAQQRGGVPALEVREIVLARRAT
ncbi:3-hydroxyacyl-ACP dehydratase FabZ family protein [Micromonospora sp. CPCC 206061]|uniref:3-hydroxyacyl-ACP dehydratase FabZ family protein n=1 Tax=Micromonospora sp. CPCC 206061 TaxID=3122410 RepID=UPI002FF33C15